MIKFLLTAAVIVIMSCTAKSNNTSISQTTTLDTSIYDFKVQGLTGDTIDLASFKGKKIMIVNTASLCGNTPQYSDLETLYKKYKDKLVIIGFPANNFGGQDPGSNSQIHEFCTKNYGVSFPMAAKVSVKGDDIAPIFQFLIAKAKQKGFDDPIKWNFTKFLIDEKGELITVIHHKTSVLSDEVVNQVNGQL